MNLRGILSFKSRQQKKQQKGNEGISLLKKYIVLIDRKKEMNASVNAKIDGYKEEYSRVLNSKRTTYSGNFDMGEIDYKKDLYIEICLNVFDKDKVDLFDKREKVVGEDLSSLLCIMARLHAYKFDLEETMEDVLERLTALNEISDEKIILRPSKRRSLNEAINGLETSYLTFMNLLHKINESLKEKAQDFVYLSEDAETKSSQDELVEARRKELEVLIEAIDPKRPDFYRSIDQNLVAIGKMQQELDEHVYTHPERVEEIRRRVREFDVDENSSLEMLEHFERLYKIYSTYGRNLINEEDLVELYEKKFALKIKDSLNFRDGEVVRDATFLEIECYERCVLNALERLIDSDKLVEDMPDSIKTLCGTDSALERLTKAVKCIYHVEKYEEDEEKAWRILNDRKLLSLLFAFERKKGLEYFFNNFLVETSTVQDVNLHTEFYKWALKIPLESIYSMKNWNRIAGIEDNTNEEWSELFGIYKSYINPGIQIFPEGITNINFSSYYYSKALAFGISNDTFKYTKMLEIMIPIQSARFPTSLRSIHGSLFSELKDFDIELNEGLIEIGDEVFKDSKIFKITIPLTLENSLSQKLSCFNAVLDTTEVDIVCLTKYDSKVGIPPSFVQGFFKVKSNKTEYMEYKTASEGECVSYKNAVFRFKTLVICCGNVTIKFSSDDLKVIFKRKGNFKDVYKQETNIGFFEAMEIAEALKCQIEKKLEKAMGNNEKKEASKL